jgi:hypothetical protein
MGRLFPVFPFLEVSYQVLNIWLIIKNACISNHSCYQVRIHIWSRSSIFDITLTCYCCGWWNPYASRAVTNSLCKFIDVRSLKSTTQPFAIVSINLNMIFMFVWQSLNQCVNILHTTSAFSHCFSGKIDVASCPVVVFEKLRLKTNCYVEVFCYSD